LAIGYDLIQRVRLNRDYVIRRGDVLYATPTKAAYALLYQSINLVHAALVGTNCILRTNSVAEAGAWVIDAVMRGRFPGVHKKPMRVFVSQFEIKWHVWMPELRDDERIELVKIAEAWDGLARWHPFKYKNPDERFFHCVGFVEYCYEQINRDICHDSGPLAIVREQQRAFRLDRYAYQR